MLRVRGGVRGQIRANQESISSVTEWWNAGNA